MLLRVMLNVLATRANKSRAVLCAAR